MSQFNRITNTDAPSSAGRSMPFMAPMWGADNNQVTSLTQEQVLMPYASVSDQPIPQFQNGRVIGISGQSGNQFQMFTENNNKCNNVKDTILYGTWTRSTLSDAYFSEKNMDNLQDMLRYQVYLASGGKYQIGKQNSTELIVVMRAVFLQYAKNLPDRITEQIVELNRQVIEYILPLIISEIKQWFHYSQQLETLPMPLELPRNLSNKGSRSLSSVVGVL
jgi:hypothetical protein